MSLSLFDEIHDSYCCYERTTPATVDEFIAFGLQAEDYSHYVALQQKFQSELAMYGHPKEDSISTHDKQQKTTYPTLNEFITFLKEKHLIEIDNHYDNSHYFSKLLHCDRFDAEYRHEWLCFPMEAEQFRLIIERKLSKWWNKEAAYLAKTFGAISFIYDDHDSHHMAEFDSPLRIRKYNPQTNDFVILKHNEVEKIFKRIQQEKKTIEKNIAEHLIQIPTEHSMSAVTDGRAWVKKMYELYDQQSIIEEVYESIENAFNARDILDFKDTDTLFVFSGPDTCKENGHLLSVERVEFRFYCKPNKQYTIQRCAHCKRFQIPLQEWTVMRETYGIPRGIILYDDDLIENYSDFPEETIFYHMGYTVSQSAGLSTEERQSILKCAIETRKSSKHQVLNFLKRRMNFNGMKPGNETALRRWKEDYEYISQL